MLSINQIICLCIASAITLAAGNTKNILPGSSVAVKQNSVHFPFKKEKSLKSFVEPIVTSDTPTTIIPFSRAGNLIIIKAKVDSTEGNFILDTGAPKLVLNLTYFRGYPSHREEIESGGITGTTSANPTMVNNLVLGPIKYYKAEADRINLGHIENSKGIKILGLLGFQLFKRFEMIIDYEKNLIHLHLIGKKEASTYKSEMLNDESLYNTFPIIIFEDKLLTHGEIAGKKLTFIIDTGAESNVLDSRLPEKIFAHVNITRRVMLAGSGTQKTEALYGDMKNIKLGKLEIGTLPVLVTNLEKMCFSYNQCLDGMLGFDFLSLHKIGFNFVKRKMYIWK
ncbi:aspartyl protease family protein [Terrimonas pollutisoli]|uniref:aspartyl protease family protein n=1 Tax=Terrimonas pollutisoli TaxID=3034147 RepID=UPI0023ECFB77|nr:pepsin/retropepsin-like aspartic protease family protein [Terrimonas sp. H1YJ31]